MILKEVIWCSEKVNIPGVAFKDYDKETAFQIYCADWLRKRYVVTRNDGFRFWHHSANERQGVRAGFTAKMMGQSKGFPDFVHLGLRLGLELKIPGGKASNDQLRWLEYLKGIGWEARVVWSFEEFRSIVIETIERS